EAAYPAPDFHDVAASGIHHVAAGFLDLLHEVRWSAESGDDDDIILGESVIFRAHVLPRQGNDPHIPQLAVYLGVVDDLADQENPVVRKHAARGVSQINRPFDAVAEAELLGEQDGGVADAELAAA